MPPPQLPPDETGRLESLRRYDVLDTPPEQSLDDLTALAAYICEAPIALISLVDERRQWFKSKFGMSVSETPRDISFCRHAILQLDLFIVPDTTLDVRFADNPQVVDDPHIRFYAGAPLVTPEGHALGTLCIKDVVPRQLTLPQQDALRALGRQAMAQLELRRHARALQESEARLLQVFRNCPVALVIHRWSDRTIVDVNDAYTTLLGWPREEVIGRTTSELGIVTKEAAAQLRARLEADPRLRDHELEVRTREGAVRYVLMGTEHFELRQEQHTITTFVDITARKQAEEASNRLAAIVESSDDAIIGKDLKGVITSWNKGAERIFGYQAEEMVGTPIMRLIPDDRKDEETHILERIRRGKSVTHFETLRKTRDGRLIDVSVAVSPIKDAAGTVIGISKVARDITQRRQAESATGLLAAIVASSEDAIISNDLNSIITSWNRGAERVFGYTAEEMMGTPFTQLMPEGRKDEERQFLEKIKRGERVERFLTQRQTRDGRLIDVAVTASPIRDAAGGIIGMSRMPRDVTELRQSEAALRASEASYRSLFESAPDGILIADPGSTYLDANPSMCRMLGYTRDEVMGLLASDIVAEAEIEHIEASRSAIKTRSDYRREWRFKRKDGSLFPAEVIATMMADGNLLAMVRDITGRKQMEQQLLRAQRMESIGTLAGGIAHDLNNVLAPILMSVELLRDLARTDEDVGLLDMLQDSAQHGVELVKQVLAFARGIEGQRIAVNPLHLMQGLLKVMRDTFPKSIQVLFEPAPHLWTVTGDPTQMHQVLLNLCINARDAMPNGGRLTVSMENVVLDETYVAMNIDAPRPGAYLKFKVVDTGTGIPPEILDRIFEPFFTTKETGKGTGLGLSTTLGIVKSHGGFIHPYSELGKGTAFEVYLPANTTEVAAEEVAVEQTRLPRGNGELILVVDDEKSIRTIVQGALERLGYRVLLASNGAEAVALYAQHRSQIAAVLTDMAMPVMDGPATVIAIRSMNPAAKIIGSSGLASNDAVARAVGAGVQHFVPKPYTVETLLTTLRQVLSGE